MSADEGQLVQVFTNMMINAQQAMPHGGAIRIRAENVVEPGALGAARRECRRRAAMSGSPITDEGIGIPEENLGRIFDPYFSTKQKGSGLGLATSYSIIKNHGGSVSVESKPGHGHHAARESSGLDQLRARARAARAGRAADGRRARPHSRDGRRSLDPHAGGQHAHLSRARRRRRRQRHGRRSNSTRTR